MREEDPTAIEQRFFESLLARVPDVQDWYHRDADGALWVVASYDIVRGTAIVATLRCDYDGERLLGGLSPGFLNWDDGVRADAAGVAFGGPSGLDAYCRDPEAAADLAATWFLERIAERARTA